jgi:hypothetical protein
MNDSMVTIVGSSYFEPISVLLEKLKKYDTGKSGEVQSGYYVNGYACSICLLAVVCLESYVMRVRFINKATQTQIDKTSIPEYLAKLYPAFPLKEEVVEIFILRDLIAHNHLWEIYFLWDDEKGIMPQSIHRRSSGDKKYMNSVDTANNKTKKLGLNISPIKIDVSDATKVLHTMWETMIFLEKKNRSQCYVSHLNVKHNGKRMKFAEVIDYQIRTHNKRLDGYRG